MNRSEEDLVPNWTENTKQGTNVRRGGSSLSKKYGSFTGCYSHKKRNEILFILTNNKFHQLFFFKQPCLIFYSNIDNQGKDVWWETVLPVSSSELLRAQQMLQATIQSLLPTPASGADLLLPSGLPSVQRRAMLQGTWRSHGQRRTRCRRIPLRVNRHVDYEQSLFFLGPSSKTPKTRKWPRAWLKARDEGVFFSSRAAALASQLSRARGLPLLNPKKKKGCSQPNRHAA